MANVLEGTEAWTVKRVSVRDFRHGWVNEKRREESLIVGSYQICRRSPWIPFIPLGAEKCITLPSSLNIFTSSICWMGCTLSFFNDACSFLSSVPLDLWTFFCFRRGVPLPLSNGNRQCTSLLCSSNATPKRRS